MLVLPISLSLALFAPFRHGRSLSQTPVGKYPPSTDVQDHASESRRALERLACVA